MIRRLAVLAFALGITSSAAAQTPAPQAVPLPRGTSVAVWAGNMLYVSGALDPDIPIHHDTESQALGLILALQKILVAQGLTLGDVVMMHVYLAADPAKNNEMDFSGMMASYKKFFGTAEQPNRPARTTVQVTLPAARVGGLIEIDLVAMRPGTGERIEVHP